VAKESALPFDHYIGGGRELLGVPAWGDGSSRRGYGQAVFAQCGFACVYCGQEMETAYEAWLALSVDHVIPTGAGKRLGYPIEWMRKRPGSSVCCARRVRKLNPAANQRNRTAQRCMNPTRFDWRDGVDSPV
jgi:hypothetical protein